MLRRFAPVSLALVVALVFAIAGLGADQASTEPAPALLGHTIFFSLKDPSEENKQALIEASKQYLSQHPGLVFFAVGTRDENINGMFTDKNYDVALHMVFTGREALGTYAKTDDHQKFVAVSTPLLKGVRIFDSSVHQVENKKLAAK